jgi:hypothetical protein
MWFIMHLKDSLFFDESTGISRPEFCPNMGDKPTVASSWSTIWVVCAWGNVTTILVKFGAHNFGCTQRIAINEKSQTVHVGLTPWTPKTSASAFMWRVMG